MSNSLFGLFKSKPRVRMAPSPTGYLHIGTARTTLFNYLYARKYGGKFTLRFEDTDKARSKKEYEDEQVEHLKWLGFDWDEYYRVSERNSIYVKSLHKLVDSGRAYISKEPKKDDPAQEVSVIRLRNPGKRIVFNDLIRGEIATETADLGDFVIARDIEDPLYHLQVVVEDGETDITHVIRGEDHIPNTARQILIQEALGYSRPEYAHLPLILAPDRSKMSKRHGATTIREYKSAGIIPEAMVNFLGFLGWNPGDEREIFSLDELIYEFSFEGLQKSGAIFNMEKLLWFNREHLKGLARDEFKKRLLAFAPELQSESIDSIVPLVQERASTLKEAAELLASSEFSFVRGAPSYDPQKLIPSVKGQNVDKERVVGHLIHIMKELESIPENAFTSESVKERIWGYATEEGRGEVLWPMRYALSGQDRSPDPFMIAGVIGKQETLARLLAAREKLYSV